MASYIKRIFPAMKVSIFGKLLIGIVIIQVLVVMISSVGLKSITNLEQSSDSIFVESVIHYNIHSLKIKMSQLIMPVNDYLIHGNVVEKENYSILLQEVINQLEICYETINSERVLTKLHAFEENLININEYAEKILAINEPVSDIHGAVMMERMDMIAEQTVAMLDDFMVKTLLVMEANIDENKLTTISAYKRIIIIGLITALGLLVGGFFYVKEITNPIKKLLIAIEKVKSDDLSPLTEFRNSTRDEMNELSVALNRMLIDLKKNTVCKNYFSGIIDRMVDSLVITGKQGKIRVVNQATLDLLGYKEEDLFGKSFSLIVNKDEPEKNEGNILNTYFSKDGQPISVLFSRSVIRDQHGEFAGMIYVACCATEFDTNDSDQELYEDEGDEVTLVRNIKAIGKVPLTAREVEIIKLIAEGHSSKEIAEKLYISVRTVETHRRNLMQKLHSKSAISLVHYAVKNGII